MFEIIVSILQREEELDKHFITLGSCVSTNVCLHHLDVNQMF